MNHNPHCCTPHLISGGMLARSLRVRALRKRRTDPDGDGGNNSVRQSDVCRVFRQRHLHRPPSSINGASMRTEMPNQSRPIIAASRTCCRGTWWK